MPDSLSSPLITLFHNLSGTWLLHRKLHSADASEPAGRCSGKATFTKTPTPSPVVDAKGKLHLADAEFLYHEQGEFEMMTAPQIEAGKVPVFSFSRKYIWRLQTTENASGTISIWFTKPGTDTIDYLFHNIDLPVDQDEPCPTKHKRVLHGTGGHVCVDDFYSSSYSFTLSQKEDDDPSLSLSSWTTLHEVRGPKKDQIIETTFIKA